MSAIDSRHKTGVDSEKRAVSYFEQLGWQVIGRRFKTPFAEIDLLVRDIQGALVVIEVKSVKCAGFRESPVSARQLARLKRACIFLEAHSLLVAAVGQDGEVVVLDRF